MKSRRSIWIAGALAAVLVVAGCVSFDKAKFSQQVQKWAPIGMSEEDAQKAMEKRGFDCMIVETNSPFNHTGRAFLDCTRTEVYFHSWTTEIYLDNKKVSGYGDSTVE